MRCVNCGAQEELIKHYIVPLERGGNDIDTNIVTLCRTCLEKTESASNKAVGRPRRVLDTNALKVFHQYIQCKIGAKKAKEMIGLSGKNNSTWQRLLKEYRQKYNITDSRNNIDVFNNSIKIGDEERAIGYVKIGSTKYEFWNTGQVKKIERI